MTRDKSCNVLKQTLKLPLKLHKLSLGGVARCSTDRGIDNGRRYAPFYPSSGYAGRMA